MIALVSSEWQERETAILVSRFAERGVRIVTGAPAFSGLYPLVGGSGNWEVLFTRHRLLVRTAHNIQEWSALTGPTPGRLLRTDPLGSVSLAEGRLYDRVLVTDRRFWVHRRYRHIVRAWVS